MLPKVGPGGGRGRRPHLPKLEALPPMETCAHTTQGSGPREQVFKHTPFPGFPLCQAPSPEGWSPGDPLVLLWPVSVLLPGPVAGSPGWAALPPPPFISLKEPPCCS